VRDKKGRGLGREGEDNPEEVERWKMIFSQERDRKYLVFRCECGKVRIWGKWVIPSDSMKEEMVENDVRIDFKNISCTDCFKKGV
jgi:hypothetical protein